MGSYDNVHLEASETPIDVLKLTGLDCEQASELDAVLNPPAPEPPPPPPPVRRAAVGDSFVIPGSELGLATVSASPAFRFEHAAYERDDSFGVLSFRVASRVVVGAIVAQSPGNGVLCIGIYDAAGSKVLGAALRTDGGGGVISSVLNPPAVLESGTYRLAWQMFGNRNVEMSCFNLGRGDIAMLNGAEGQMIIATGHSGTLSGLPDKLGELSEPNERFPLVPKILLKG